MDKPVSISTAHSKIWYLTAAALVLLALVLVALPLHSLFVTGPFRWQVRALRFVQGGIEASLFGVAIAIACLIARGALLRIVLVCILGLLYLRLNYVDLPLLLALAYVESLLATGRLLVGGWHGDGVRRGGYMLHLLCGVGAYAVLIASLSMVHLAYPMVLFGLVIGMGLVSTAVIRRAPHFYVALQHGVSGTRVERLVFAVLFMTVLVMAAKTHLIDDYDSWWYGLRSQYVLAQGGTMFADLGMSHFVFYYPKLYEALILPLCAFPDKSYPACFNLIGYAILLFSIHHLALRLAGDRLLAALITLVVGWLPVLVFSALLVKPDLLSALMMFVAACYLARFVAEGGLGSGAVGAGALALSLACKLTAVPFGGLMAIMSLPGLYLCLRRSAGHPGAADPEGFSYRHGLVLVLGLAAFLVFTARTYVLTGLPYVAPDFLVTAFKALGLQAHFPYAPFSAIQIGGDWHFDLGSLGILDEAFFDPAALPHIVYSWIGDVFVLTGLLAVCTLPAWRRSREFSRPFLLLGAPLFLFTLFFIVFLGRQQGGAGYYYVFPLLLFTAMSAATLRYVPAGPRGWVMAALLIVTAADGFTWFGSTPQWRGGTAAYSKDLTRSTFTKDQEVHSILEANGLAKIGAPLELAARGGHCTALADGDESLLFNLPCGVESAHTLQAVGSPYLVDSSAMSRYIAEARFDFLVVPNIPSHTPLSEVFLAYAKLPGAVRIDDQLFSALDLRGAAAPLPVLPATAPEPKVSANAVLLTGYFPALKATFPDEKRPSWRLPFTRADERLKKYLDVDALVMATDTTMTFASDAVPFRCPGHMSFWLGLLPVDQLHHAGVPMLTVRWSDAGSGRALGSLEIPLPQRGFQSQSIALDKCGKPVTRITFRLHDDPGAQPVSAVIANPLLDN